MKKPANRQKDGAFLLVMAVVIGFLFWVTSSYLNRFVDAKQITALMQENACLRTSLQARMSKEGGKPMTHQELSAFLAHCEQSPGHSGDEGRARPVSEKPIQAAERPQ